MVDVQDVHCIECGNWLDPRWRACPTCGVRLAPADRIDRVERVTACMAIVAGAFLMLGAILPWAMTTSAVSGSATRWGMSGGRGVAALVLGLCAIALGSLALTGRRFAGRRTGLVIIGLLAIGFVILQRSMIVHHVAHLQFQVGTIRDLTAAQAAAQRPTNSFGVGLWMIAIGGVLALVAGLTLPKQIASPPLNTSQPDGEARVVGRV